MLIAYLNMVFLDENCCNTCAQARLNRAGCDWIAGRKANSALIFRRLPDFVLLLFSSKEKTKAKAIKCRILPHWEKRDPYASGELSSPSVSIKSAQALSS